MNLKSTILAPCLLCELQNLSWSHGHSPIRLVVWVCCLNIEPELDRVFAALAGADADGFVDGRDEDLAVADAARARDGHDGFDDVADDVVLDDDLDADLRDEVDDVGRAR